MAEFIMCFFLLIITILIGRIAEALDDIKTTLKEISLKEQK